MSDETSESSGSKLNLPKSEMHRQSLASSPLSFNRHDSRLLAFVAAAGAIIAAERGLNVMARRKLEVMARHYRLANEQVDHCLAQLSKQNAPVAKIGRYEQLFLDHLDRQLPRIKNGLLTIDQRRHLLATAKQQFQIAPERAEELLLIKANELKIEQFSAVDVRRQATAMLEKQLRGGHEIDAQTKSTLASLGQQFGLSVDDVSQIIDRQTAWNQRQAGRRTRLWKSIGIGGVGALVAMLVIVWFNPLNNPPHLNGSSDTSTSDSVSAPFNGDKEADDHATAPATQTGRRSEENRKKSNEPQADRVPPIPPFLVSQTQLQRLKQQIEIAQQWTQRANARRAADMRDLQAVEIAIKAAWLNMILADAINDRDYESPVLETQFTNILQVPLTVDQDDRRATNAEETRISDETYRDRQRKRDAIVGLKNWRQTSEKSRRSHLNSLKKIDQRLQDINPDEADIIVDFLFGQHDQAMKLEIEKSVSRFRWWPHFCLAVHDRVRQIDFSPTTWQKRLIETVCGASNKPFPAGPSSVDRWQSVASDATLELAIEQSGNLLPTDDNEMFLQQVRWRQLRQAIETHAGYYLAVDDQNRYAVTDRSRFRSLVLERIERSTAAPLRKQQLRSYIQTPEIGQRISLADHLRMQQVLIQTLNPGANQPKQGESLGQQVVQAQYTVLNLTDQLLREVAKRDPFLSGAADRSTPAHPADSGWSAIRTDRRHRQIDSSVQARSSSTDRHPPDSWQGNISSLRLEKLTPQDPKQYFLYAEELAGLEADLEARTLAIRLYVIAIWLGRDDDFRSSCLKGLIAVARDQSERQRFEDFYQSLYGRHRSNSQVAPPRTVDSKDAVLQFQKQAKSILRGVRLIRKRSLTDQPEAAEDNALATGFSEINRRWQTDILNPWRAIVDAAAKGRANSSRLTPSQLHQTLQLERKLKRWIAGKVKIEPPSPGSVENWASQAVGPPQLLAPIVPIETLTEFDPARNIFVDGNWYR